MPRKKRKVPARFSKCNENWTWSSGQNNSIELNDDSNSSNKKTKLDLKPIIISKCEEQNKTLFLGKMCIGHSNNIFPEEWKKCKLFTAESSLNLKFDEDSSVVINLISDNSLVTDIFSSKIFKFRFSVNIESQECFLFLYFNELPLPKFSKKIGQLLQTLMVNFHQIDMSDVYDNNKIKVHEDLEELYGSVCQYRKSSSVPMNETLNVQHHHLLPTLRAYQSDAVRWMIGKEQSIEKSASLHPLYMPVKLKSDVEIYFNKYTGDVDIVKPMVQYVGSGGILADEMGLGKTVEVLACILNHPRTILEENTKPDNVTLSVKSANNPADIEPNETIPTIETQEKYVKPKVNTAVIRKKAPKKRSANGRRKVASVKLAAQIWYESKLAEMKIKPKTRTRNAVNEVKCVCGDFARDGIVKCYLCNKLQHTKCMGYKGSDHLYCCPQCWMNQPLIKSKATLIVSPEAISKQWSLEVVNHIRKNGLKVFEYKGIHSGGMVYPTTLAEYDLIITTYSVLQSELKFTNEQQPSLSVSLRYAKRYNVPNTPLLFIEWWRLCLDEAQTVECPSSQVSCMAQQLHAVHRWAVTGTPIQKNIIAPYNTSDAWNHLLYYPYIHENKQPMIEFLSKILWRSAKVNVIEQINIPPQTIEEHWLEFSAVEKFFYRREHELCANNFLNKLNKLNSLDVTLKSVDRHTLNVILTPLLTLRQACTHPHAVRGKYLASKRQVNTMEELLEALTKKNIHECEESMRAVIAALNGMAGILLLQERSLDAVEKYREALCFVSQYDKEAFIKVDKLQQIHTLHNLSEVLGNKCYPTPPPTLRDDTLQQDLQMLQCKYMDKYIVETCAALQDAKSATNNVQTIRNKFEFDEIEWCTELLHWFVEQSLDKELLKKIEGITIDINSKMKHTEITGIMSLIYIITMWTDRIDKQLENLRKVFDDFEQCFTTEGNQHYFSDEIVEHAMECHLRPAKNKKVKKQCLCCTLDSHLKKYECILFQMNTKVVKETKQNTGTWHPCVEEHILKAILAFGKLRGADRGLLKDGEIHVALCESRRKEFKELRKLYTFYDQQVSAQDELNICKIRFRLRLADEPVKEIQKKRNILKNLDYEIENQYEFIHVLNYVELDHNYTILQNEKIVNEEQLKKLIGTQSYLETLRKQQYAGQNPDPCPICAIQLTDSWSILHCGHCYCLECISKLLEHHRSGNYVTCSVCRKRQQCHDVSYIKVKGSSENTIDDIHIQGSHSTKVHAVVRQVLKLRQTDEKVKILIFSTWEAVLKVLSTALTLNNIVHEHVSHNKLQEKLQRFKDMDEQITALLLPVRLGAKGLNLTEASHVFLVEPLMNPGEELQAIGRVHRIGQTKPTVVHRFLIKSTIEENIHNAISENAKQWDNNILTLGQLKDLFTENTNIKDQLTN
ncbi:uncharacterized protein CBL_04817 [Carabus blaptoides fortunei]